MLYLILPVHDRAEKTRALIGDLRRQTLAEWHLLLIDDGSTDGTADTVTTLLDTSRLTLITGDGSLWWGGALQVAWEALHSRQAMEGDAVLILNNDVRIGPQFLAAGMKHLEADRSHWIQAIAISGEGIPPSAGIHADLRRLRFIPAGPGAPVNCLSTRGLLLSLRSFQESGGFRPWLLPHYWSDYEFTIRAARRGVPLATCNDFELNMDRASTGIRTAPNKSLKDFLAIAFSKRYVENPIYASIFVILCCPWVSIPVNLLRVWSGLLRNAYRAARTIGDRNQETT